MNTLVLLNDVVNARGADFIRTGTPYESRSTLPTSITHPLNVHSDGNAPFLESTDPTTFATQPPTQSGDTAAWPSAMTPSVLLVPLLSD